MITAPTQVLVQGITGRQGSFWTERMIECGTRVVGGRQARQGRPAVHGIPVYDTRGRGEPAEHTLDAAVMFVPPAGAPRPRVEDAIAAGVALVVLPRPSTSRPTT